MDILTQYNISINSIIFIILIFSLQHAAMFWLWQQPIDFILIQKSRMATEHPPCSYIIDGLMI